MSREGGRQSVASWRVLHCTTTLASPPPCSVLFLGSDQTTEAENFDRDVITLAGVQARGGAHRGRVIST